MKDYMSELKEALKSTVLRINLDKIDPDKDLMEQGIDSFDHLMMLYAIEDYFKINISDDFDNENFRTLNKILNVIELKESEKK